MGASQSRQPEEENLNAPLIWLDDARAALHTFDHHEAIARCQSALANPALSAEEESAFRCILAAAWENLAHYKEAVETLSKYESDAAQPMLSVLTRSRVLLRLGSAYGGTAEIPKAISFAKKALGAADQSGNHWRTAQCHALLGTLYRRLGELWFAHEHLERAILLAERNGDRLTLAQAYNGQGIAFSLEGKWNESKQAYQQARGHLADGEAPLLQGTLDVNLANIDCLQGQMRPAVKLYERAIPHLEIAQQPRLIANARANLGYCLLRLGEFSTAQATLEQALAEAHHCEALLIQGIALESMGELVALQGKFSAAETYFQQSLKLLKATRNGFNEAQALLTRGRCLLLAEAPKRALENFTASLEINEHIGDPRGRALAQVGVIEAKLALGETAAAQTLLASLHPSLAALNHTPLSGAVHELEGHLAIQSGNAQEAIAKYHQAASIQSVLEDRYRLAVIHYHLGNAYARSADSERAKIQLGKSLTVFRALSVAPMVKRAETLLASLPGATRSEPTARDWPERIVVNFTALLEIKGNSEVLLHEATRQLHEEYGAALVLAFWQKANGQIIEICRQGAATPRLTALTSTLPYQSGEGAGFYRVQTRESGALWLYFQRETCCLTDAWLTLFIRQLSVSLEQKQLGAAWLESPSTARPDSEAEYSLPGIIYASPAMKKIAEQIHNLRSSNINVLITGESGTGKELIANAIHTLSKRAQHPFVPFNCAAAPRDLIESQIFGHKRGAFTGATADSPGVAGAAHHGTLFLDEIGELSLPLQPKLLRFLQQGEIHRVGDVKPTAVNVRVLAATNCDLEQMVADGNFRADLLYRLNVIQLHLPPLRERREDIPQLIHHFFQQHAAEAAGDAVSLAPETIYLLTQYDWPGNIRQLENEIRRLLALTPAGKVIQPEMLSAFVREPLKEFSAGTTAPPPQKLDAALAQVEKQLIQSAMKRQHGNITKAASELGLSRLGLRNMIRRHQLSFDVS
ncbi:MAG: sigma 54-interacting transcriptional regulator [Blastocatellia bacterium]